MSKPRFGTFVYTKFDDVPCSHSSENVARNRSTNEAARRVVALATWRERHQSCGWRLRQFVLALLSERCGRSA